jgi:hypothetical protein
VNKQQLANSTTRIAMASPVAACLVLGAAISANVALAGDGPESDLPSVVSSPGKRSHRSTSSVSVRKPAELKSATRRSTSRKERRR